MMLSNTARLLGAISSVSLLLTVVAWPEITSKGKHTRVQEAQKIGENDSNAPGFPEPISNVTVSVGRDALLSCVVDNLKGYKVAWVRVDTQTILSIHHNVISQNNRISLSYNDHRSWYLHIREVEETDRGWYMCQVNTDPMRSQKGYLQVVVPPVIIESLTSNDMVVREGLNVTLMCKARGYPEPYVMWRREDGEEMLISGEHVNVVDGELLHITKVSRLHMAAYLCVASNGVPPSISKRVHLRVQFPPMLSIPNQLEGAYIGQDVILECHTEAYPASINYWTTERGDMIISDTSRAGDKYETTSTVSGYTKYMKLKIRSVGPNDFGTYRCVAKNSLGETDGNIKLDEMPTPTTAVISEMSGWNRSLVGKHRHRNKFDLNALPDYGVEEWRDGVGNGVAGNSVSDSNQTPVRNPPGAFHNSANSLAQHNLLGGIILWIKMQSFGICKHLSNWYHRQRQHRKEQQKTERKQKQRQKQPQELEKEALNQGIQHAEQQHNNWLPLKKQPKNQFSSLQRFAAACEQSSASDLKEGAATRKSFAAAYTQHVFRLPLQWLIRRIGVLHAATKNGVAKAKFANGKNNELQNKGKADAEPTQRHVALILRLPLLTALFSRAITTRVLPTIATKIKITAVQMLTNVSRVGEMTDSVGKKFVVALKNVAASLDRVDAAVTVTVCGGIRRVDNVYSSISEKESWSRQTQANSSNTENDGNNKRDCGNRNREHHSDAVSFVRHCKGSNTKNNKNMRSNNKNDMNTLYKVDNNFKYNLHMAHIFHSHIMVFLLLPLLVTFTEMEVFFEICFLSSVLFALICKAHIQKRKQQQITEIQNILPVVSVLQLTNRHRNNRPVSSSRNSSSSTNSTSKSTTTERTRIFPISCQRLANTMKIISTTRTITLLCLRQWVVWKSAEAAIATSAATSLQPQTTAITSSERPIINRSITVDATEPCSAMSTQAKATAAASGTLTLTVAVTLTTSSIVLSLADCCGSTLR